MIESLTQNEVLTLAFVGLALSATVILSIMFLIGTTPITYSTEKGI